MSSNQESAIRPHERPALRIVRPAECDPPGALTAGDGNGAPASAANECPILAIARWPHDRAAPLELPTEAVPPNRWLSMLSSAIGALNKVATELGVTSEDHVSQLEDVFMESERRLPQIVVGWLVRAELPRIEERAFKHFFKRRRLSWHDAKELSQETVLKVLAALPAVRPDGNVGAWVARIRRNVYLDYRRKCARRARGMERLEKAYRRMKK